MAVEDAWELLRGDTWAGIGDGNDNLHSCRFSLETNSAARWRELDCIADHICKIQENVHEMIEKRKSANNLGNSRDIALAYDTQVKPFFEPIRYSVDKLELIVEDEIWPLAKYREMLDIPVARLRKEL